MAYHANVKVIEGDLAVLHYNQSAFEMADSPRVFQFNNQEPHVVAKEYAASGVGTASLCAFSPNGRYLVWTINQRVVIYDLQNNKINDTATGVTLYAISFTGDSTTALIATNSAPFIIAVNLYDGTVLGSIGGTFTFTANSAVGSGYGSKCYLVNKGSGAASSSLYEYNASTNSITTVHTSGYNYGYVACSASGKFMIAANGSTASGARTYIFDLDNLSIPPATIATVSWGMPGTAAICAYGTSGQDFMMLVSSINISPRCVKITKGAALGDYTMSLVTASGQGAMLNSINAIDNFGFVYCGYLTTYPFYNEAYPISYIDLRGYTSGNIVSNILPGINGKYSTVSVSKLFTIRRLSGHVRAVGSLAARKVVVFNRRTMRKIAETMSDSNGAFTIPIYNGEPCLVMALGNDIEDSDLIDHVAPVV